MTDRRCWNGCREEPWCADNVFCRECYDRLQRTGSSKRPSARRQYTPPAVVETRKVSLADVEREYRKALEESER